MCAKELGLKIYGRYKTGGAIMKSDKKTEKQLRSQISIMHNFILKHSFSKKLIPGDDYVYVCKFCGKEGYEKSSTQHKRLCEVGGLLNKASKTQRNHLA